jgi:hypothetical protein
MTLPREEIIALRKEQIDRNIARREAMFQNAIKPANG